MYSIHYMLAFPLWIIIFADYLSMNYKYPTFYVISSCFVTIFQYNYTNGYNMGKYPTIFVRFTLGKHQYRIQSITRYMTDNYVTTFLIFQIIRYMKTKIKIYPTFYVSFSTILSCYFHRLLFINEG